jgi:putative transposase
MPVPGGVGICEGRFGSVAVAEANLHNALRYVSLNPVRARLTERAADWPWSSLRARLASTDDALAASGLERIDASPFSWQTRSTRRQPMRRSAGSIGRPIGEADWIQTMEARSGRALAPAKRGPKPGTKYSGPK